MKAILYTKSFNRKKIKIWKISARISQYLIVQNKAQTVPKRQSQIQIVNPKMNWKLCLIKKMIVWIIGSKSWMSWSTFILCKLSKKWMQIQMRKKNYLKYLMKIKILIWILLKREIISSSNLTLMKIKFKSGNDSDYILLNNMIDFVLYFNYKLIFNLY